MIHRTRFLNANGKDCLHIVDDEKRKLYIVNNFTSGKGFSFFILENEIAKFLSVLSNGNGNFQGFTDGYSSLLNGHISKKSNIISIEMIEEDEEKFGIMKLNVEDVPSLVAKIKTAVNDHLLNQGIGRRGVMLTEGSRSLRDEVHKDVVEGAIDLFYDEIRYLNTDKAFENALNYVNDVAEEFNLSSIQISMTKLAIRSRLSESKKIREGVNVADIPYGQGFSTDRPRAYEPEGEESQLGLVDEDIISAMDGFDAAIEFFDDRGFSSVGYLLKAMGEGYINNNDYGETGLPKSVLAAVRKEVMASFGFLNPEDDIIIKPATDADLKKGLKRVLRAVLESF